LLFEKQISVFIIAPRQREPAAGKKNRQKGQIRKIGLLKKAGIFSLRSLT